MVIRTDDLIKFDRDAFEDKNLKFIGGDHNIQSNLLKNAIIMGFSDDDTHIAIAASKREFPPAGYDRYETYISVDDILSGKCIIIPIKS